MPRRTSNGPARVRTASNDDEPEADAERRPERPEEAGAAGTARAVVGRLAATSTPGSSSAGGSCSSAASSSGVARERHAAATAAAAGRRPGRPGRVPAPGPAPPRPIGSSGRRPGRRRVTAGAGSLVGRRLVAPRRLASSGPGEQRAVERRAARAAPRGCPRRRRRPPSTTTMRSARRSVERRWAMRIVVRPSHAASQSVAWISSSVGRRPPRWRRRGRGPRVGEQRPGQGDALALAAREREAALADHRVVAVGQLEDEVVGLGRPGRGARPRRRWRRDGRRRCWRGPCRRTGSSPRTRRRPTGAATSSVTSRTSTPSSVTAPVLHVVEAGQQQRDGRLARAGRARRARPARPGRGAARSRRAPARSAGSRSVTSSKLTSPRDGRRAARRPGRLGHLRGGVEQLEDPLGAGPGLLADREEAGEHPRPARRAGRGRWRRRGTCRG